MANIPEEIDIFQYSSKVELRNCAGDMMESKWLGIYCKNAEQNEYIQVQELVDKNATSQTKSQIWLLDHVIKKTEVGTDP